MLNTEDSQDGEESKEAQIFEGCGKEAHTVAKYGPKAQAEVKEAMNEFKEGTLKSGGKSRKKVTNPKQAIAIGLSQARKKGAKVPKKRSKKKS